MQICKCAKKNYLFHSYDIDSHVHNTTVMLMRANAAMVYKYLFFWSKLKLFYLIHNPSKPKIQSNNLIFWYQLLKNIKLQQISGQQPINVTHGTSAAALPRYVFFLNQTLLDWTILLFFFFFSISFVFLHHCLPSLSVCPIFFFFYCLNKYIF